MGDMADDLIEDGLDFYIDHLNGHPTYPDQCPYCEEEKEERKEE